MWLWSQKRHLRYRSLEAWYKGEGISGSLFQIADPEEQDRRLNEYAELRQHLFRKHLATLSSEEQRQFDEGAHPSQDWDYADAAKPFCPRLREHLAQLGFNAEVNLGFYHFERIVLCADLEADPGERRSTLPWLFRGFEVKYLWPGPEHKLRTDP
jgi:hypothetical protein